MDEPTHQSPRTATIVVPRHSALTRLTHWINVVAMLVMLMSGLQILNAHPALYWGESGFSRSQGWFHLTTQGSATAFPGWITVPSYRDLATGRRWHFFFAWVLIVNGLAYLFGGLLTRHLWKDLIPSWAELHPRRLASELWHHLKLQFPRGEAARHYNSLQKIAYAGVVFVVAPLAVLTGLTISNGIGWSPDGTTMYLADSGTGDIDAFDFDPATGDLGSRRTVAHVTAADAVPDGLTVDDRGDIWVALWNGGALARYHPDGSLLATIPLPVDRPTSCAFGGTDGATLFVTTAREGLSRAALARQPDAGRLLRLDSLGATGPPCMPYRGKLAAI